MAYSRSISIALGTSQTGLSLEAQLIDDVGSDVGSTITTGFVEIGNGNYLWTYDSFDDDFHGGVKFSASSEVKAFASINPVDVELQSDALENVEIDGFSLRKTLAVMAAALLGKVSGSDTTIMKFTSINGTDTRINSTVDKKGNRKSVTLTFPE